MPRYLVLYRSSVDAMEQMAAGTSEQAQEGMQLWMKWAQEAGSSLIDLGSPVGKSQTLPGGADTGLSSAASRCSKGTPRRRSRSSWTATPTCMLPALRSRCSNICRCRGRKRYDRSEWSGQRPKTSTV